MVSDDVLNEVTRRLVEGFHPEKIILFGSQARGTADERTDVDILVICRSEGKRRDAVLEMDRALWGMRLARDMVLLTPEEYERGRQIPVTIARYASLEGRVLHDVDG